ncbi:MAG: hypothetical protein KF684_04200 [Phycisphaeraceae bacterium]|nr:hypothetical protein [Phycisphaeraceae bacterium]
MTDTRAHDAAIRRAAKALREQRRCPHLNECPYCGKANVAHRGYGNGDMFEVLKDYECNLCGGRWELRFQLKHCILNGRDPFVGQNWESVGLHEWAGDCSAPSADDLREAVRRLCHAADRAMEALRWAKGMGIVAEARHKLQLALDYASKVLSASSAPSAVNPSHKGGA